MTISKKFHIMKVQISNTDICVKGRRMPSFLFESNLLTDCEQTVETTLCGKENMNFSLFT